MKIKNVKINKSEQSGFTLIEIMIATGLFVVVMVVGVGAVLNVNTTYRKTQKIRSIVDNLGFAMEDMSKTLRTGTKYDCPGPILIAGSGYTVSTSGTMATSACPSLKSHVISFQSSSNAGSSLPSTETVYIIVANGLYKSVDGGNSFVRLTPSEVVIDDTKSGFTIIGAPANDGIQSHIIINLEGNILYRDNTSNFALQTTVTSRVLDN